MAADGDGGTMNSTGQSIIVVGVAPSHPNDAALTFAMREATLRGTMLELITAWEWDIDSDTLALKQSFDVSRNAALAQEAAMSRALANAAQPPRISRRVVQGDARLELCRRARNADLLVVGKTDKNVIKRVLLGSVSHYCVRYAPCPVAVVPEARVTEQSIGHDLGVCPVIAASAELAGHPSALAGNGSFDRG
jgi:nucleotide-binding universal stress UspA family protein